MTPRLLAAVMLAAACAPSEDRPAGANQQACPASTVAAADADPTPIPALPA
jgi:hypothetical protein